MRRRRRWRWRHTERRVPTEEGSVAVGCAVVKFLKGLILTTTHGRDGIDDWYTIPVHRVEDLEGETRVYARPFPNKRE